MTNPKTTIAIHKTHRPAISMLAECYRKERELLEQPEIWDTVATAVLECLSRRGIEFLPAPDDAELVPVVTVQK